MIEGRAIEESSEEDKMVAKIRLKYIFFFLAGYMRRNGDHTFELGRNLRSAWLDIAYILQYDININEV
jgi:hypothetical protein